MILIVDPFEPWNLIQPFLFPPGAVCLRGRCICRVSHSWSAFSHRCVPFACDDAHYATRCKTYWSHSVCVEGNCVCESGYSLDNGGLDCLTPFWDIILDAFYMLVIAAFIAYIMTLYAPARQQA